MSSTVIFPALVVSFLLVPWCQGQMEGASARIVHQPEFKIIPLNTVQTYSCSGIATFVKWTVNNVLINAELRAKGFHPRVGKRDELNHNLRTNELTVLGNNETNNSMIACFAIIVSPPTYAKSNPVQVLVLDNLDHSESVNNLTVTPAAQFLFSWTPPFTLEGLPIHGYNVTVTNTLNRKSKTFFVVNTTQLVYVIDNPDPNDNFTVSVFPINAVGPGESKEIQVPKCVSCEGHNKTAEQKTTRLGSEPFVIPSQGQTQQD